MSQRIAQIFSALFPKNLIWLNSQCALEISHPFFDLTQCLQDEKVPYQLHEEVGNIQVIINYPNSLDLLAKLEDLDLGDETTTQIYHEILKRHDNLVRGKDQPFFRFAKLRPHAVAPRKLRASDVGYDLVCIEKEKDMSKEAGENVPLGTIVRYRTGLKIEAPFGWSAVIEMRSSASKTGHRLGNVRGTIDVGYNGELLCCFVKDVAEAKDLVTPFCITQLKFERFQHFTPVEVEPSYFENYETNRGGKGFGSTEQGSISTK